MLTVILGYLYSFVLHRTSLIEFFQKYMPILYSWKWVLMFKIPNMFSDDSDVHQRLILEM